MRKNLLRQPFNRINFAESEIPKSAFLVSFIVITAVRIFGDVIFLALSYGESPIMFLWRTVTGFLVSGSAAFYFFYESFDAKGYLIYNEFNIPRGFKYIAFTGGVLFALSWFIPDAEASVSFFSLIYSGVFNSLCVGYAFYIFKFITFSLMNRRHERTFSLLETAASIVIAAFIIEYLMEALDWKSELWGIIKIGLYAIVFGIIFFTARRNNWIGNLDRDGKWKLFGLSFSGIAISIFLLSGTTEAGYVSQTLDIFMPSSNVLTRVAAFMLFAYSIRIFLRSLYSLPNSEAVEKKSFELNNLIFINSYIADPLNRSKSLLLDLITDYALKTGNGSFAWTEIYNGGSTEIAATANLNKTAFEQHYINGQANSTIRACEKPTLIQSLMENSSLEGLKLNFPYINSLIIIPLYSDSQKTGALIVAHSEPYGLEIEDVNVLAAFGDNISLALENARLFRASLEKERIQNELNIARDIQRKLLPAELPSLKGFSVGAFSLPAHEVGGDYYDVINLAGGERCIVIADVSGKGMSAAFYMAQLKGMVQTLADTSRTPAELLRLINKKLYGSMDKKSFVTMSALALNESAGSARYARAGHTQLLLKSGDEARAFTPRGIGLGLAPEAVFNQYLEELEFIFAPGDCCILFTDGITELKDSNGAEIGIERLLSLLDLGACDGEKLSSLIEELIENNCKPEDARDDMSAVALCYAGPVAQ
ncbi:MAG: GAF domain-containing SpoIIE family protein phosphatase [Chloroflexota bacterium]